jgi:hypothetical protein
MELLLEYWYVPLFRLHASKASLKNETMPIFRGKFRML